MIRTQEEQTDEFINVISIVKSMVNYRITTIQLTSHYYERYEPSDVRSPHSHRSIVYL